MKSVDHRLAQLHVHNVPAIMYIDIHTVSQLFDAGIDNLKTYLHEIK